MSHKNRKENNQHEQIRLIAQQIYEKRGAKPGHELDDWLEAERRVKNNVYCSDGSMSGSWCR